MNGGFVKQKMMKREKFLIVMGGEGVVSWGMKNGIWLVALLMWGMCYGMEMDYREIGRRLWMNDSDQKPRQLVQWDEKQECALMGIGSCTWRPTSRSGSFDEGFPKFVAFARERGVQAPDFMKGAAPWADPADFESDDTGMKEKMHAWLAEHLELQAQFLVARVSAALPGMMRAAKRPQAVREHFEELMRTPDGVYCLVDYLCFMGDGTQKDARGTGLLHVLQEMRTTPEKGSAAAEFAGTATALLQRRAKAPKAPKSDVAHLGAWLKRCRTYSAAAR